MTDASGQVEFTAVDQVAETVTYSAVDVTDGNIPFPTTGIVTSRAGPPTDAATPLHPPRPDSW